MKVTEREWNDLVHSNLAGPFWFVQAAAPYLQKQAIGKIVNFADASLSSPWVEHVPYSAAKGGIVTMTRGLAKALAPKIQVNAIAPGPMLKPPALSAAGSRKALNKTLLKRWGGVEPIVETVLFLLKNDFITGQVIAVDGGRQLA